jgi:PIN domain nuclease of toxin-antitoxin system
MKHIDRHGVALDGLSENAVGLIPQVCIIDIKAVCTIVAAEGDFAVKVRVVKAEVVHGGLATGADLPSYKSHRRLPKKTAEREAKKLGKDEKTFGLALGDRAKRQQHQVICSQFNDQTLPTDCETVDSFERR